MKEKHPVIMNKKQPVKKKSLEKVILSIAHTRGAAIILHQRSNIIVQCSPAAKNFTLPASIITFNKVALTLSKTPEIYCCAMKDYSLKF